MDLSSSSSSSASPEPQQNEPLILYRPISGRPRVYTQIYAHIQAQFRNTAANPQNPHQEFTFFSRLPIEIRHSIWRLLRGPLRITTLQIPDPKQRYLYTAPYYSNPLLRINHESRALALESCLYFLAPVDMLRVISHPALVPLPLRYPGGRRKQIQTQSQLPNQKQKEREREEEEREAERTLDTRTDIKYLTQLFDSSSSFSSSPLAFPIPRQQQPEKSDIYTFPFLSFSPLAHLQIKPHTITHLAIDFASWEFEGSKPERGNLYLVMSTFPNLKELVILLLDERSKSWAKEILFDDLKFLGCRFAAWTVPVCRLLEVEIEELDYEMRGGRDGEILGTGEVWYP